MQAGSLRTHMDTKGLSGCGLTLQSPRTLVLPEAPGGDRQAEEACVQGEAGRKLTSLWKATQAETRSTGSSTTTQHGPCSCSTLFSHTETGIFSPPRLTTSTCGQRQARSGPAPAPGTRAPAGAARPPDVLECNQNADEVSDAEPYNLSECSRSSFIISSV